MRASRSARGAHRERVATFRTDFDGHLVCRATDATALDLDPRLHRIERLLEHVEWLFFEALLDDAEGAV